MTHDTLDTYVQRHDYDEDYEREDDDADIKKRVRLYLAAGAFAAVAFTLRRFPAGRRQLSKFDAALALAGGVVLPVGGMVHVARRKGRRNKKRAADKALKQQQAEKMRMRAFHVARSGGWIQRIEEELGLFDVARFLVKGTRVRTVNDVLCCWEVVLRNNVEEGNNASLLVEAMDRAAEVEREIAALERQYQRQTTETGRANHIQTAPMEAALSHDAEQGQRPSAAAATPKTIEERRQMPMENVKASGTQTLERFSRTGTLGCGAAADTLNLRQPRGIIEYLLSVVGALREAVARVVKIKADMQSRTTRMQQSAPQRMCASQLKSKNTGTSSRSRMESNERGNSTDVNRSALAKWTSSLAKVGLGVTKFGMKGRVDSETVDLPDTSHAKIAAAIENLEKVKARCEKAAVAVAVALQQGAPREHTPSDTGLRITQNARRRDMVGSDENKPCTLRRCHGGSRSCLKDEVSPLAVRAEEALRPQEHAQNHAEFDISGEELDAWRRESQRRLEEISVGAEHGRRRAGKEKHSLRHSQESATMRQGEEEIRRGIEEQKAKEKNAGWRHNEKVKEGAERPCRTQGAATLRREQDRLGATTKCNNDMLNNTLYLPTQTTRPIVCCNGGVGQGAKAALSDDLLGGETRPAQLEKIRQDMMAFKARVGDKLQDRDAEKILRMMKEQATRRNKEQDANQLGETKRLSDQAVELEKKRRRLLERKAGLRQELAREHAKKQELLHRAHLQLCEEARASQERTARHGQIESQFIGPESSLRHRKGNTTTRHAAQEIGCKIVKRKQEGARGAKQHTRAHGQQQQRAPTMSPLTRREHYRRPTSSPSPFTRNTSSSTCSNAPATRRGNQGGGGGGGGSDSVSINSKVNPFCRTSARVQPPVPPTRGSPVEREVQGVSGEELGCGSWGHNKNNAAMKGLLQSCGCLHHLAVFERHEMDVECCQLAEDELLEALGLSEEERQRFLSVTGRPKPKSLPFAENAKVAAATGAAAADGGGWKQEGKEQKKKKPRRTRKKAGEEAQAK